MTKTEAFSILGLSPTAGKTEIKKRYRQLMTQVHPDVHESFREAYPYTAQEINTAYALLEKETPVFQNADASGYHKTASSPKKKSSTWNAPVNQQAYRNREILHYMEDMDGVVLGTVTIAEGKYLWQPEEDFPLFLLSIYKCSKEILDETEAASPVRISTEDRSRFQAELAYLLAQQFIDGTALLHSLGKKAGADKEGLPIFYLPSMLEPSVKAAGTRAQGFPLKEGDSLFPSRIHQHKLYLKNQAGQELGYLSFRDDRLYYVVIPLFEQRRVKVKIRVPRNTVQKKTKTAHSFCSIDLWVKLIPKGLKEMPENLNLQIQQLLASIKT